MNIMVISPHPDDETLGAGGAILKFKDSKNKIYWLNITNMKKEYGFKNEEVARRQREIGKVIKRYGFNGFFDLGLKPAGLDEYPISAIISAISRVVSRVRPQIAILPYCNDIHSDHRIVFEASFASTKIFRHPYVKKILMMEVMSETDFAQSGAGFVPNYFIDISKHFEKKTDIMKVYKKEVCGHPFPRSAEGIRALAMHRGVSAGCKYAEGFVLLKGVE